MPPIDVPPDLKKISPFLRRAEELDRDRSRPESRVTAYACRQYAVQVGIPLASSAADPTAARECLGAILGGLETEKVAMAVFSREEHARICHDFADKVFEKADGEDRGGVANKGTARTFYAAGTFYEILEQFYTGEELEAIALPDEDESREMAEKREVKEEEDQRRVYCKWKATEILKAIKEGRTPEPGGYKTEPEEGQGGDDDDGGDNAAPAGDTLSIIDEKGETPYNSLSSASGLPPPAPTSNDFSPPPPSPPPPSNDFPPPPPYDGIELNLNGDPTFTPVEDASDDDDDIFIPGALSAAASSTTKPAAAPPRSSSPPLPQNFTPVPPPVAAPRPASPSKSASSSSVGGMVSGMFSRMGGGGSKNKLPKETMNDAMELTNFALAALKKGEADLGAERLRQALEILERER